MIEYEKALLEAGIVSRAATAKKDPNHPELLILNADIVARKAKIAHLEATPEQLITSEAIALKSFFGKEIKVVEPPKALFQTLEQLNRLGIRRFEPHYLPQLTLKEEDNFPGWKVEPEKWFWERVKDGSIEKEAATLQEGWYLVDGRVKPNYNNGKQMYEDDYLGPMIEELRRVGKIQDYPYVPEHSRFGVSPKEIEGVILPEFAKTIKIEGVVRSKRYIEFNVWGNMFYPQWGETNTWEWFADKYEDAHRLFGGHSDHGGLACVFCCWSGNRDDLTGFSPVVAFPSKP